MYVHLLSTGARFRFMWYSSDVDLDENISSQFCVSCARFWGVL